MNLRHILLALALTAGAALTAEAALITSTGTKPSVGNGNSGNPYEIRTAEELRWFVHYENTRHWFPNDHAKLMADIDLSGICGPAIGSWVPLGHPEESGACSEWRGKLFGNGHTVTGLYIDGLDLYHADAGFCGGVDGVTITDLTVKGQIVNAQGNTGGLIGKILCGNVQITDCVSLVDIDILSPTGYTGGLVGYIHSEQTNSSSNITRCSYQGSFTGHSVYQGSLIGSHEGAASVKQCSGYSAGSYALIGTTYSEAAVSNCLTDHYLIYQYTCFTFKEKWAKLRDNLYVGQEWRWLSDAVTPDTEGSEAVDSADLASGAACYRMNQKMGGRYFTQTIGVDPVPYPGDKRATVYRIKKYTNCDTADWLWAYSNTDEDDTTLRAHTFAADEPYCTSCHKAVNPDYGIARDAEGYYLAASATDIEWLWALVNVTGVTDAKIRLTADIDMAGAEMQPLALFAGELDGQGHTLAKIRISCTGVEKVGLVGKLTGSISHLTLTGTVEASYASYLGAFAGYVWNHAKVSHVRNDCTVKAIGDAGGDMRTYIGGVAGYSEGSVTYAINNGPVVDASTCSGSLRRYIAGVVGYAVTNQEVSHLANCAVVGATVSASTDGGGGAAVVNVRTPADYADSYYVLGISNPGLDYFFSHDSSATDQRLMATQVGSGELAWLLSGKDYDSADAASAYFGQTIGTDLVPYPCVSEEHKGVYHKKLYYTCSD